MQSDQKAHLQTLSETLVICQMVFMNIHQNLTEIQTYACPSLTLPNLLGETNLVLVAESFPLELKKDGLLFSMNCQFSETRFQTKKV